MEVTIAVLFIGLVIFFAHLFAVLYAKTRIPDVLLLFLVGFLFGPILDVIRPSHFGAIGQVFSTITLILILFESGGDLSLSGMRQSARGLFGLTIMSFISAMVVSSGIVILFTTLSPGAALMLGAITGGTSSAIVIPVLDKLRMRENSKTTLIFESIINDVLCIVVTFSLISAYQQGDLHIGLMILRIAGTFILAGLLGVIFALIWSVVLKKIRILQNSTFTTLAFVFVVYGIVEFFGFSGAISALVFGYVLNHISRLKIDLLGNWMKVQPSELNDRERGFFAEVVFLLKTFFFIYIGVSIQVANTWLMMLGLLVTLALFLIRIPIVRLTMPKFTPIKDATLMSIVIPKGLAAAVLASIPLHKGIPGGDIIQTLTYTVVLFSIIISSILIYIVEFPVFGNLYQRVFRRKFSQGE